MSVWQELGIEATGEPGLIRKAYAAKLKVTRPEDDPEGFVRLRAAYEAALAMASRIAARPAPERAEPPAEVSAPNTPAPSAETAKPPDPAEPDIEPDRETQARADPSEAPAAPASPPVPAEAPRSMATLLPAESEAAIREIADALNRHASEDAAELLLAARSAHLLPLRSEFALADRLAEVLLSDNGIPTDRLIDIATRLGWYDPFDILRSTGNTAQNRLCARIGAEKSAEQQRLQAEAERARAASAQPGSYRTLLRVLAGFAVFLVIMSLIARLAHIQQPVSPAGPAPAQSERSVGAARTATPDCLSQYGPGGSAPSAPFVFLENCAESGFLGAQNALGQAYLKGDVVAQSYSQALSWFRRAAGHDYPPARRNLAYMHRNGLATARDPVTARKLYLENAEVADPDAQLSLADMMISGEGGPVDWDGAFRWTKIAAFDRNRSAMTKLGDLYARGIGCPRDLIKSAAWRRAAALAGDTAAMHDYGLMAMHGEGMPEDVAEAYRWFSLEGRLQGFYSPDRKQVSSRLSELQRVAADLQIASWHPLPPNPPDIDRADAAAASPAPNSAEALAAKGSPQAQSALGLAYLAGDKVPRDPKLAAYWLRRAADQDDPEALWALGYLFSTGLGVARDPAEAERLLLRSAQMHFPQAEYLLALMLIEGQAGSADPNGGFVWMKKSALLGFLPAMNLLGDYYAVGTGTARDLVKSAAWRRAAAAAGEPMAMYAFGLMSLRGVGVPENDEEGYRWLRLAMQAAQDRTALAEAKGGSANSVLADQERRDASASVSAKAALEQISPELLAPEKRAAIDQELKSWHAVPPVAPAIDAR